MDAVALAALHDAAFGVPRAHGWGAKEFAAAFDDPTSLLITADGGYALARRLGPDAELLLIATDPAQRQRGMAAALLAALEAELAQTGSDVLFLEVAEGNTAARALYDRAGFAEIGRRRAYYPDGGDALTLSKPLDAAKSSKTLNNF